MFLVLVSTPEIRMDCPDDKKFEVVARLAAEFKKEYQVIDVDGARVLFDGGWGLIRASNTQPVLVLRFEATDQQTLEEIRRIFMEKLAKESRKKGKMSRADRPLVLATRNQGKIEEFKDLFSGFPMTIKSLNDFGPIPQAVEDGKTFEDNAYKKAHFTARVLGFPALADDSGLVVEALDGPPGVLSARYAGENADDARTT